MKLICTDTVLPRYVVVSTPGDVWDEVGEWSLRVVTVREKSGKNKDVLRSGKIFDIVKVSEKSEFCFTIYSS